MKAAKDQITTVSGNGFLTKPMRSNYLLPRQKHNSHYNNTKRKEASEINKTGKPKTEPEMLQVVNVWEPADPPNMKQQYKDGKIER